MRNEIYIKNRELLSRNCKWVIQDVESFCASENVVCHYETGEHTTGLYIDCGDKGIVQLGSQYAPDRYARQWCLKKVGNDFFEKNAIVFVFGFGSGEYVKALCEYAAEITRFIIFEPSLDILRVVLETIDLAEFITENCVIISNGENGLNALNGLLWDVMTFEKIHLQKFYELPNYVNLFFSEYELYRNILNDAMNRVAMIMRTKRRFAHEYVINRLECMRSMLRSSSLCELLERLPKNYPAIIISAGPSLQKNIVELKRAKGKAFLIAVDTALKPLLANGIIPDIFVTVDPIKYDELFENEQIWNIPAVIEEESRGKIVSKLKNKIFYACQRDSVFMHMLMRMNKSGNLCSLMSGGSVANSAFSFALAAQMSPIILIGQDLAYTDDKKHIAGAFHDRNELVEDEKEKSILVEDIHGNMVHSARNLLVYKKWFEDMIEINKCVDVIDATEGGAKINGTRIMDLKTVIDELCLREYDYEKLINECGYLFNETERADGYRMLLGFQKEVEEFRTSCDRVLVLCRQLQELSAMHERDDGSERILLGEIQVENKLLEESLVYSVVNAYCVQLDEEKLSDIGKKYESRDEDLTRIAGKLCDCIEALVSGIEELKPDLEVFLQEV